MTVEDPMMSAIRDKLGKKFKEGADYKLGRGPVVAKRMADGFKSVGQVELQGDTLTILEPPKKD